MVFYYEINECPVTGSSLGAWLLRPDFAATGLFELPLDATIYIPNGRIKCVVPRTIFADFTFRGA
jgi:hypothetical protein